MKANYVVFSDGAESKAYLDQERWVIRVYEKSNFKSLMIGNLYVKLLAFLEKDPS